MEFTHSIIVPNEAVVAATVVSKDLPVNPLSFLLVTLKCAQNQANTQIQIADILLAISKLEVLYKGSAVISMSGADLYACGVYIPKFETWGLNMNGEDNDLLAFTWMVPFGRFPYFPRECFPATSRGELILQISFAAAFTKLDAPFLQVEAVELPEASPEQFLKMTTLAVTPTATGIQPPIRLPIGNKLSDILLFGTTIPALNVATKTINSIELSINNLERYYSGHYFETAHNQAGIFTAAPTFHGNHYHQIDGGAYAQYMDTSAVKQGSHPLSHYIHLPLDVLRDGTFILDTKGLTGLDLNIDAGDTNAIRVVPVELVGV
jgi:hypothetical protein